MLMVSDMLQACQGDAAAEAIVATQPLRFSARGHAPRVVVWNVCRHCNMTCPHCYAAASVEPSKYDLDTAAGKSLIDELAEAGVRVLVVSGGEPLLRTDVFELLSHAKVRGLIVNLSSNGVLIDDQVAEQLAAVGVSYVGVSIDGLAEFNDVYRGHADGFARATFALSAVRRAGMRAGMRITVSKLNIDAVVPLWRLACDLGIERFYVSHLVYAGRARSFASHDLSPREARSLLQQLFVLAEARVSRHELPRIVCGSNDSAGPLLLLWVAEHYGNAAARTVAALLLARGGNSAGDKLLAIDHRGRVHPDQFWRTRTLGQVGEQPFLEILRHPLLAELRERHLHLRGRCRDCAFVAVCRGSHRERAEAATSDMWEADPACVLSDEEIARVDLMLREAS